MIQTKRRNLDLANDAIVAPFPNIHLSTLGYNKYYGNPLAKLGDSEQVKMDTFRTDPGLRKPLFKLSYSRGTATSDRRHTVPDGYYATVDNGCSTESGVKEIRSLKQYQDDLTRAGSVEPVPNYHSVLDSPTLKT